MLRAELLALMAAAAFWLAAVDGRAQDEGARAEAARLFKQGSTEFAEGRYAEAAESFDASHRLVPRAAALYSAARSWDAGGAIDRAADDYQWALSRTDLHGAEAEDARKRLAVLQARVGVVSLQAPDDARVWLGHVRGALGAVVLHLMPGEYDARVERSGDAPWLRHLTVAAGAAFTLTAAIAPVDPRPPPALPRPAAAPATLRTLTWTALGVAAAGALASGVLYAASAHARDQFDATGDRDAHLRDAALSWRTAAYTSYGVTAAALAAGVTLYLVW